MRIETFEELENAPNYKYTVKFIPETEKDVQELEKFKEYMRKQQMKQQAEFDIIMGKFPYHPSNEIKPSVAIPCNVITDVVREVRMASSEKERPCYGRTNVSLEDCKTCSSFATCYRQDLENLILTEGKGRGIQKIDNG